MKDVRDMANKILDNKEHQEDTKRRLAKYSESKSLEEEVKYRRNKQAKEIYDRADRQRNEVYAPLKEVNKREIAVKMLRDHMEAQQKIRFITDEFTEFAYATPGSLSLILAVTGTGKSTFAANIAHELSLDNKRVLIIVNEEASQDVFGRISCLRTGINFLDYKQGNLSDAVRNQLIKDMQLIDVNICDLSDYGKKLRTYEGLDDLLKQAKGKYDAVIIDYFQNVNESIENPAMEGMECLKRFADSLDFHKGQIGCPIILFAQVRHGEQHFEERIKGRKVIAEKATNIFEIFVDVENQSSLVKCHKSRFNAPVVGKSLRLAYENGKFIQYTQDFKDKVEKRKIDKMSLDIEGLMNDSGISDAIPDGDKNDKDNNE